MAIKYYPNRIQKKDVPSIDRVIAKRRIKTLSGFKDVAATPLNVILSCNTDWIIDSVLLDFSSAGPRDYSAAILNGRKILTDLNDAMWIQTSAGGPQRITLDPTFFYSTTTMCNTLKAELDGNAFFAAQGITFTVTFDATTGKFTITPSAGQIRYLNETDVATTLYRDSIGGHIFGFNVDTAWGASATSDTAVWNVGAEANFITATASTVLSHYHDDIHNLNVDQALHLRVELAGVTVNYTIAYEEII